MNAPATRHPRLRLIALVVLAIIAFPVTIAFVAAGFAQARR